MSMSPLLGSEDALGDVPPLHPSDSSLVLAPTLSLSIGSKALHVHGKRKPPCSQSRSLSLN